MKNKLLPYAVSPKSMTGRADFIGVSPKTLHEWRANGIDVFDDDAIRYHLRMLPRTPPNVRNRFFPHPPLTAAQLAAIEAEGEEEPEEEYQARLTRESGTQERKGHV